MERASASSNASRDSYAAWETTCQGTPAARATSRPAASARLLITAATRAPGCSFQPSSAAALRVAPRLVPRPEIRTTMFLIVIRSDCTERVLDERVSD